MLRKRMQNCYNVVTRYLVSFQSFFMYRVLQAGNEILKEAKNAQK